ncbi:hypothetical protein [Vibrio phage phiKT1028]|nr:hypothetical protein [Vibrio phage phiKT1028]
MYNKDKVFTTKHASKFENNILLQEPELLSLYRTVLNFDYYYDYSDDIRVWRSGSEVKKSILEQLSFNELHPYYPLLQKLYAAKGDRSAIEGMDNPFADYMKKYNDPSMEFYHFLHHLDLLGVTELQMAHMIRAARFIARFLIAHTEAQSPMPVYPYKLIYTKELGVKNTASDLKDKMCAPVPIQRYLKRYINRVEFEDFESFGMVSSAAGTSSTVLFDVKEEMSLELAYIKGYHFSVPYSISDKLRTSFDRSDIRFVKLVCDVLSHKASVDELMGTKYIARA